MLEINLLDIAVILVLLICLLRGALRGLTGEVAGLVGLLAAFVLARQFQGALEPYLGRFIADTRIAGIVAYGVVFFATMLFVHLLFALIKQFINMAFSSWLDRLLGAFAGVGKGLLVLSVAFYLAMIFVPNAALVRTAKSTPLFYSMTDYLRNFLPSVFPHNLPIRIPGRI
jgi:membrane protein required for colicin V production